MIRLMHRCASEMRVTRFQAGDQVILDLQEGVLVFRRETTTLLVTDGTSTDDKRMAANWNQTCFYEWVVILAAALGLGIDRISDLNKDRFLGFRFKEAAA